MAPVLPALNVVGAEELEPLAGVELLHWKHPAIDKKLPGSPVPLKQLAS